MSKIEVNAVEPQCGTTLTLGASGDTVTLGSGASQSGFGRTGTVDWQTGSIKTATFTAANGEGYFCNTTSSGFTVNLPAGSAGAIVSLQDYNNTFDTNALTVTPNGSEKINGGAGSVVLSTEGEGVTLVYIDSTVGWRSIQDSAFSDVGSNFILATGGTITECGNCKIHTFTGPGTFTVSAVAACSNNNKVGYMVVAGGGGGGGNRAGGGGAGGFREGRCNPITPYTASPLVTTGHTVTATSFPITVGAGGTGQPKPSNNSSATAGGVSVFSSFTSAGGGGGRDDDSPKPANPATNGGSGGGAGGGANSNNVGGDGNSPPVSPAQGQPGGSATAPCGFGNMGGGGGGATVAGKANACTGGNDGNGGCGATTHITGSPVAYAGGGGAGNAHPSKPTGNGCGGAGGGGNGGTYSGCTGAGNPGTINTGGGGGGSGSCGPTSKTGGNGGSGIVIIRYKFQ